jgi:hypothetical protein
MDNTFLAEIHGRLNRAKVLLKIVLVSASLGLILSILTDFLPYEITGFAVGAVILLTSTSILWYLAGRDLISTFHDLMKTPFERLGKLEEFLSGNIDPKALIALRQSQIPDSTLKDLIGTFTNYFGLYALIFYSLEFVGFLNVFFYVLLEFAPKVIKNFSIPLQPFVGFLTVAVPVTVSIALGLTEWRGDSLLNNPRCILDLLDNLKSRKSLLFSDFVFLLFFLILSFSLMPITLTLKIGVVPILVASAIIGLDLGFLAGIVHHLVLEASYRDFVYLNCLYRQLMDKVAQQAQDIIKQGAQHPTGQGQGT